MDLTAARNLAIQLMSKHNLIQAGWRFEFDRAKTRFGRCSYARQVISMSAPCVVLNEETEMRDTILHEIAHALVGCSHGHNHTWQMKAVSIGARPEACSDKTTPEARYTGHCVSCGVEVKRHKLTRVVRKTCYHIICRKHGKDARIEWSVGPTPIPFKVVER